MKTPPSTIGLFQPYPHTFGGTQSVVLNLAKALPAVGLEALVISPERGAFTEMLDREQIRFLVSDPGPAWHVYGRGSRSSSYLVSPRRLTRLPIYWWALSRSLSQQGVGLLHCNDYRGVLLAAPAARLAGIPVLWHMHGFIPSLWANLAAALLVDGTVLVSRGMLEYLQTPRWLLRPYRVIHNGLPELAPRRTDLARPPAERMRSVIAVGALHPRKGYETLIAAFKEVADRVPGAHCRIVGAAHGDGAYAEALRDQVQRLGLNAHVQFHGHSKDVHSLLEESTLLVVPSRIEAFGMVAVEAMLAGKAVVASRTGGLSEIVVDHQTGRLVEPGQPAALAQALTELLTHPARTRQMGWAGRKRAREHFGLEKMAASFADYYRELLHPASKRRSAREPVTLCPSLNRN